MPTPTRNTPAQARFSAAMRDARQTRGMAYAVLGELVGCSAEHLRLIEGGKRVPTWPVAARIIAALGLDAAQLVYGGGSRTAGQGGNIIGSVRDANRCQPDANPQCQPV